MHYLDTLGAKSRRVQSRRSVAAISIAAILKKRVYMPKIEHILPIKLRLNVVYANVKCKFFFELLSTFKFSLIEAINKHQLYNK